MYYPAINYHPTALQWPWPPACARSRKKAGRRLKKQDEDTKDQRTNIKCYDLKLRKMPGQWGLDFIRSLPLAYAEKQLELLWSQLKNLSEKTSRSGIHIRAYLKTAVASCLPCSSCSSCSSCRVFLFSSCACLCPEPVFVLVCQLHYVERAVGGGHTC